MVSEVQLHDCSVEAASPPRLGVTVVIPTYNAGALLERCLGSIRAQRFPTDRLEILVLDGGSTDGTCELAERYGCRVVNNPLRLAEPGVRLGLARASHPIRVVMAADNAFPVPTWLDGVVRVFETTHVRGVYTGVVPAPEDSAFCRYFNRLHADPFNWFVFRRAANPHRFAEIYRVLERGPGYVVYDLSEGDPPLLALAQGFALRGELVTKSSNEEDDILPLWELLDSGDRLAYVDAGIHHLTVLGFRDFLRKYRRRAQAALQAERAAHQLRQHRLAPRQRLRRWMWIPYSLSIVGPVIDALRGIAHDRDPAWLFHPAACLALSGSMAVALIQSRRPSA